MPGQGRQRVPGEEEGEAGRAQRRRPRTCVAGQGENLIFFFK